MVLSLAACVPTRTYVGEVEGTDAVVGLVTGDGVGRLYLCGGPTTMSALNQWFELAVDGDTAAGWAEGWTVFATGPDPWAGELMDPTGASWNFTAEAGVEGAGPYEAKSPVGECPAGAVVLDAHTLRGVACPTALVPAQVVPVGVLRPGGRVAVRTDDGALSFVVEPAAP
ncbi:MAG: hypothetical protein ABMA64_02720 [Myxococcota bacterium]